MSLLRFVEFVHDAQTVQCEVGDDFVDDVGVFIHVDGKPACGEYLRVFVRKFAFDARDDAFHE